MLWQAYFLIQPPSTQHSDKGKIYLSKHRHAHKKAREIAKKKRDLERDKVSSSRVGSGPNLYHTPNSSA